MSEAESSVFQSSLSVDAKLDRARTGLLDLSARNRLLNMPRFSKTAKTIDVVDERSNEIYRLLVKEGKTFTFAPGKPDRSKSQTSSETLAEDEPDEETDVDIALPEDDDEVDGRGILRRHSDTRLQTRMTPTGLQTRLLDLFHDARTLEEEQGVNILFLALGTLKWIDPANKENIRYAPLVLVPVRLQRGTAGERFKLSVRPDDLTSNLSLESYLDQIHAISLPPSTFGEDFEPAPYFEDVASAVSTKEGWSVQPDDIVLGFFSFAKFLMYRDLDPENWPANSKLADHEIIRGLLSDGFPQKEEFLGEDVRVDAHIQPIDMLHIVDSDSSQTLAVHDVRKGRNLVIQGPPGTGKSQTIANVIASAVADGKTVLFVAEKMAALEVVKRRLDSAGVGDACLELHSNKANKRALLEELKRTWELGSPRGEFPSTISEKLQDARDHLNGHADRMHEAHRHAGLTPYQVVGHLVRLRQGGQSPVDVAFEGSPTWSREDFARRVVLVQELTQRIDDIGLPGRHPWNGVGLDVVLPTTVERLTTRIENLAKAVDEIIRTSDELAKEFELSPAPATIAELSHLGERADKLAQAPTLSPASLTAAIWEGSISDIRSLVRIGSTFEKMLSNVSSLLTPGAVDADMAGIEGALACLPETFSAPAFANARELAAALPQLIGQGQHLASLLGSGDGGSIGGITKLIATAERVAAAPDASPDAFAATVWDHGLDQAEDLAREVAKLESVRAAIGSQVVETAWRTDVTATRQALAIHTGMLKTLNGDWRRARTLARSLLKNPEMPPEQIVPLLDTLMEGQAAASTIQDADAFGRAAFGMHWRGERSQSAPLLALVEWMRTLRGMGAEPRLIAGRLADRGPVGEAAVGTRRSLSNIRPMLVELWSELGSKATVIFGEAAALETVAIGTLRDRVLSILQAEAKCSRLLNPVPDTVSDTLKRLRYLDRLQGGARAIDKGTSLGIAAFGDAWYGRESDWTALDAAITWIEANGELRHLAARKPGRSAYPSLVAALTEIASNATIDLNAITEALKSQSEALFGSPSSSSAPLRRLQ